jgi:SAM-dependent methyltransferase
MIKDSYGKSNHYLADNGKQYFQWQNELALKSFKIESKKFKPYIETTDTVMDFGCGGGHILSELVCRKKIGVEINPYAREIAKKYGIVLYDDLSYIEKNTVDKAISNHCLEHVANPIEVLKQIKDCLAPGGKLILCLPIDDWR